MKRYKEDIAPLFAKVKQMFLCLLKLFQVTNKILYEKLVAYKIWRQGNKGLSEIVIVL